MNEFTKDELQEVKRCVKYMINGGITPYSSLTIAINKKLQSMIDNYCEHKKDVWPLYTTTGDLPSAGMCYECNNAVNKVFIKVIE